jgi:hypothetical protein
MAVDRAITFVLGTSVQESVQNAIVDEHHGEKPVGSAILFTPIIAVAIVTVGMSGILS